MRDPVKTVRDVLVRLAHHLDRVDVAGLESSLLLEHLKPVLVSGRYLIILDHLDALEDLPRLLAYLGQLPEPTRYLHCSRRTIKSQGVSWTFPLPELSFEDSERLIQHELRRMGRAASLSDEDMETIYAMVGGLPLALGWIAHQLRHDSLSRVLHDLHDARSDKAITLYTDIYHQSWLDLNANAQALLRSISHLLASDISLEASQMHSPLTEPQISGALEQLLDHSLLSIGGTLHMPTYICHQFTRTFCQTPLPARWAVEFTGQGQWPLDSAAR
jgi:hypothetical protein